MTIKSQKLFFLPIIGIMLFLILYFVASIYYPGGSMVDQNAKGFSWVHNFWCNLLNETAIYGEKNNARPIALVAMLVLSVSLSLFWIIFPKDFAVKTYLKRIVQFSGVISMCLAFFIFTNAHDFITNLASFFGVIALLFSFIILKQLKWKFLFRYGLVNLFLVLVNNIFYYNADLLPFLPLIQKISFLIFLVWFCLLSWNLRNVKSYE